MYKILIVDDESAIRNLIAKYAAFEGYETDQAENGMTAVEKCRENDYDLVILDIMMPELDGFSAGRQIKKDKPELPIILLSARGEEYDRINGFEIGGSSDIISPATVALDIPLIVTVLLIVLNRSPLRPSPQQIFRPVFRRARPSSVRGPP